MFESISQSFSLQIFSHEVRKVVVQSLRMKTKLLVILLIMSIILIDEVYPTKKKFMKKMKKYFKKQPKYYKPMYQSACCQRPVYYKPKPKPKPYYKPRPAPVCCQPPPPQPCCSGYGKKKWHHCSKSMVRIVLQFWLQILIHELLQMLFHRLKNPDAKIQGIK